MAVRETKTLTRVPETRVPEAEQPAPDQFKQRKRPEDGQFRLQVDRQTKASYQTFEAAEAAGIAIKKGHPNLQVAVYDGVASVNKTIELPGA